MRTQRTTQRKGRPAGRRKSPRNITLDRELAKQFQQIAFDQGVSFSCYIERLMRDKLAQLQATA